MALFKKRKKKPVHQLHRIDLEAADGDHADLDKGTRQIINLLNYTKSSGSAYDGVAYDVGYHSLYLGGRKFSGQRDPEQRFATVPYDFSDKRVLDLGCNQGGMILHIADQIQHGTGIDYDAHMVNVANKISRTNKSSHTEFYVLDLENEPLEIIRDLVPGQIDICFLLSVCMWISNWQEVIAFCKALAPAMLFETNGSADQQQAQIDELHANYSDAKICATTSEDDPKQKKRQLLLCTNGSCGSASAGS